MSQAEAQQLDWDISRSIGESGSDLAGVPPPGLLDLEPSRDDFRAAVVAGLSQSRKELPCRFLYDERGSQLFERICDLEEYYPTRTEVAIMCRHAPEMAAILGSGCLLMEYGSGSSRKTRVLLDCLEAPAGYVPVDISRARLLETAQALAGEYPRLEVLPVCADYLSDFPLPKCSAGVNRKVIYFPGSTIGNLEPPQACELLRKAQERCGTGSGLLIGVDLKKDPHLLHAAYNDSAGVTAEFSRNLLARINRELDGDFVLDQFEHYAFLNPPEGRVELHLLSLQQQVAHVAGQPFSFRQGESICTEHSYKYTVGEFAELAEPAGYELEHVWMDEDRLFSVQYLAASGGASK